MKTSGPNKVVIKIDSQETQEIAKSSRTNLKVFQEVANKENLISRKRMVKEVKLTNEEKPKQVAHKAVQTGEAVITAEDLTSDNESNVDYWRLLAEKRGESLNDSLQENERLKDKIECLENENKVCKELLEESKHLVAVLQEMLGDDEDEPEHETDNCTNDKS
ncbi:hypothetical protein PPYR_13395 [Photinus pyralis]|uniref:Geminin n=2 Tax=Photinus pyralis TaxID=7054 RepID=A0A5N4A8X5_PHOPY|nr:geminin-like [Photinus pyralis]XP_031354368.1 geminin-like [Photinus pyralis]KAB0793775.1 hypothetical protein PPYR_13395 [Photinus pyralis]